MCAVAWFFFARSPGRHGASCSTSACTATTTALCTVPPQLKDIQSAVESLHKGVYTVVKDEMCIPVSAAHSYLSPCHVPCLCRTRASHNPNSSVQRARMCSSPAQLYACCVCHVCADDLQFFGSNAARFYARLLFRQGKERPPATPFPSSHAWLYAVRMAARSLPRVFSASVGAACALHTADTICTPCCESKSCG